jgi:hypothetical protein
MNRHAPFHQNSMRMLDSSEKTWLELRRPSGYCKISLGYRRLPKEKKYICQFLACLAGHDPQCRWSHLLHANWNASPMATYISEACDISNHTDHKRRRFQNVQFQHTSRWMRRIWNTVLIYSVAVERVSVHMMAIHISLISQAVKTDCSFMS